MRETNLRAQRYAAYRNRIRRVYAPPGVASAVAARDAVAAKRMDRDWVTVLFAVGAGSRRLIVPSGSLRRSRRRTEPLEQSRSTRWEPSGMFLGLSRLTGKCSDREVRGAYGRHLAGPPRQRQPQWHEVSRIFQVTRKISGSESSAVPSYLGILCEPYAPRWIC
jgi:hypothetical protein